MKEENSLPVWNAKGRFPAFDVALSRTIFMKSSAGQGVETLRTRRTAFRYAGSVTIGRPLIQLPPTKKGFPPIGGIDNPLDSNSESLNEILREVQGEH